MAAKPGIFIHTNEKQIVGAIVSKYSFERFAPDPSVFEVKLIETKDYPWFKEYEGRKYLRDGLQRIWAKMIPTPPTMLTLDEPELT